MPLTLTIEGANSSKTFTVTEQGDIKLSYPTGSLNTLSVGQVYYIIASSPGNEYNNPMDSKVIGSITIMQAVPTFTLENATATLGAGDRTLSFNLQKAYFGGYPLSYSVSLSGETVAQGNATANGDISFTIPADKIDALSVGNHTLAVSTNGNDENGPYYADATLAIGKANPVITGNNDLTYKSGAGGPVSMALSVTNTGLKAEDTLACTITVSEKSDTVYLTEGTPRNTAIPVEILTALDVGTYSVKVKTAEDPRNNAVDDVDVGTLTVTRATPTAMMVSHPLSLTHQVGKVPSNVSFNGTASGVSFEGTTSSLTLTASVAGISTSSDLKQTDSSTLLTFSQTDLNALSAGVHGVTLSSPGNINNEAIAAIPAGTITLTQATPSIVLSRMANISATVGAVGALDIRYVLSDAFFNEEDTPALTVQATLAAAGGTAKVVAQGTVLDNGNHTLTIPKDVLNALPVGMGYLLSVQSVGNLNNEAAQAINSFNLDVFKATPQVTPFSSSPSFTKGGPDLSIPVQLTGAYATAADPLALTLTIGEGTASITATASATAGEGTVAFTVPAASLNGLAAGSHKIYIESEGNGSNEPLAKEQLDTLSVEKAQPEVTIEYQTAKLGQTDDLIWPISLDGAYFDGTAALDYEVKFITTPIPIATGDFSSNGDTSFSLTPATLNALGKGNLSIMLSTKENEGNESSVAYTALIIGNAQPNVTGVNALTYVYGSSQGVTVALTVQEGYFNESTLAGTLTFSGKPYPFTTNGNGTVQVTIPSDDLNAATAGVHNLTATIGGDANNEAQATASAVGTITIEKATPTLAVVTPANATFTVGKATADLTGAVYLDGAYFPAASSIEMLLNIGEVSTSEAVLANGQLAIEFTAAQLNTLPADEYIVTATIVENGNNNGATLDIGTVTINKAKPALSIPAPQEFTLGTSSDHSVTVTLSGAYIETDNITVDIEFNGASIGGLSFATNGPGSVTIPASTLNALSAGEYTLKATFPGDTNNEPAEYTKAFDILPAQAAITGTNAETETVGSIPALQLAGSIAGADFKLGGLTVQAEINGVTATTTVSANGAFTVDFAAASLAAVPVGTHTVKASIVENRNNVNASDSMTLGTLTVGKATPVLSMAADQRIKLGQAGQTLTFGIDGVAFVAASSLECGISHGSGTLLSFETSQNGSLSGSILPSAMGGLSVGVNNCRVYASENADNEAAAINRTFTVEKATPAIAEDDQAVSFAAGNAADKTITCAITGGDYFGGGIPLTADIGGQTVSAIATPTGNGDFDVILPAGTLNLLAPGEHAVELWAAENGRNASIAKTQVATINVDMAQPVLSITQPAIFTGTAGSIDAKQLTLKLSDAYFGTGAPSLTLHCGIADLITIAMVVTQNGDYPVTFSAEELNTLPAGSYSITVSADANACNLAAPAVTIGQLTIDPATPSLEDVNTLTGTIGQVGARDIEVRLSDAFATADYPLMVYAAVGTVQASVSAGQNGTLTLTFAEGALDVLGTDTHTIRAWTDSANASNEAAQADVGTLKISKAKPVITGDASASGAAGNLDDLYLTLTLENASFATDEALTVTLLVGGLSSTVSATANGTLTFPLTAAGLNTLAKDQYPIYVQIAENGANQAADATRQGTLTINKATPSLTVAQPYDINAIRGQVGAQSLTVTLENAFFAAADPLIVSAYIGDLRQEVSAQANGSLHFDFTAEALDALGLGEHAITVRAAGNANNEAVGNVTIGMLTIAKATPVLSGDNDLTAINSHIGSVSVDIDVTGGNYTAGPLRLTADIGGITAEAVADADDTVRITFADGALDGLSMGEHAITVKSDANAYNNEASAEIGALSIEKQRLTISGSNTLSDWAGRPTEQTVVAALAGAPLLDELEVTATVGGVQMHVSVSDIDEELRFVFAPDALADLRPGTYSIVVFTEETASCEAAQAVVGTYTVRQASSTISGGNASQVSYAGAVGDKLIAVTLTNGDFSAGSVPLTVSIGTHSRVIHATQDGTYYFTFPSWTLNALAAGWYPISATVAATEHVGGMTIQLGVLTVLPGSSIGPASIQNPEATPAKTSQTDDQTAFFIGGDALLRQLEAAYVNTDGRRLLPIDFAERSRGLAKVVITIDSSVLPEGEDITFIVETAIGRCIFTADAVHAWCGSDGQCTLTLIEAADGLTVTIENAEGDVVWTSDLPMMRIGVPYTPAQAEDPALLALAAPDGETLPTSIYDDGMVHADIFTTGTCRVAGDILTEPADWDACMQSATGWGYDATGALVLFDCNGTARIRE